MRSPTTVVAIVLTVVLTLGVIAVIAWAIIANSIMTF